MIERCRRLLQVKRRAASSPCWNSARKPCCFRLEQERDKPPGSGEVRFVATLEGVDRDDLAGPCTASKYAVQAVGRRSRTCSTG